jgi:phage host-nuclease inhibitor protein Gam
LEVAAVATQKLKNIVPPEHPSQSFEETEEHIRAAKVLIRKKHRNEDTRDRRLSKTNAEFDKRNKEIDNDLDPLLDKVFDYIERSWEELAPSQSPETLRLSDVTFVRYIDKKGTKVVDEATVIEFIKNIDTNEMIKALRHVWGDEIMDAYVERLKAMVTTEEVTHLDSDKLKELKKEQPALEISGFAINYNNKLTMSLPRSAAQIRDKKPAITEARALRNNS